MDKFLNIKIIGAPSKNKGSFKLKRKVLTEKFIEPTSVNGEFIHFSKTILIPGENIWCIDADSLDIYKFTIADVPSSFDDRLKIWLFDNKGEGNKINFSLIHYMKSINSMNSFSFYGIGGRKIICSSEIDLLKKMEIYIPQKIREISISAKNRNLSLKKSSNQKERLKELERYHKKILKLLENR